ncbi:MAG: hypothetical protein AAB940_00415 [Patescibacteria group bacterium]
MPNFFTEKQFEEFFKLKLGEHYERALIVFTQYGKLLSWDVTNVLLHASDKGKVDDVLTELEEHWKEHLQFQHPEIRGTVESGLFGLNKTRTMFLQICQNIL